MASGDLILQFLPQSHVPALTNAAIPDERLTASDRHPILNFSASGSPLGVFKDVLPPNYGGGNLSFEVGFIMASATTGNVGGKIEFENDSAQDHDTANWGSVTTFSAVAVPSTNGAPGTITGTVTSGANMQSLTANQAYRLRFTRDNSVASNASGDLSVLYIRALEA